MKIYKIGLGALLLCWMASCTKETIPVGNASLTIIHAVVGANPIRTNFKGTTPIHYARANRITYGKFTQAANRYNLLPEAYSLGLYQEPDTLANDDPMYLFHLDFPVASIHTLFLTGTVDFPESVLVEDEIPYFALGDSTMGMRFVNLSPGSPTLSVSLAGGTPGSEVSELPYKAVSGFKLYPIEKDMPNYVFEFRDANTGALLASYTAAGVGKEGTASSPNTWLYRNFTLALVGDASAGNSALQLLLIPHWER